MAKASKSLLNESGENGHPCLVPDLGRNDFGFSSLRITFAVGLSYMTFSMLRKVSSMPTLWRIYIKNRS